MGNNCAARLRLMVFWISTAGIALEAGAQTWTYPGCDNVTNNSFRQVSLIRRGQPPDPELSEPVKMALEMDAAGNVDIYFTELRGKLKRYNGASKTVQTLATLNVWKGPYGQGQTDVEEGLVGIALDPNFKTNHWLYLYYSPMAVNVFRIARFTLSGNALDMGSETVLLDIPSQREDCCHTGGAMQFDAYGDLWVTVGNNTGRFGTPLNMDEGRKFNSDEWGATCTAGLRGGIIRIHPLAA